VATNSLSPVEILALSAATHGIIFVNFRVRAVYPRIRGVDMNIMEEVNHSLPVGIGSISQLSVIPFGKTFTKSVVEVGFDFRLVPVMGDIVEDEMGVITGG
jgi:hypothetical protein